MYPLTPPASDLSRARLKQLATWIRDELDLRVAREGPDVLRPDDVLTLHETFIALRQAQNITVSDLRATGIHKAVQDIAGVATRWPGRLCDDCDKIISIWTGKFGPFGDIHPFLYGRCGRLEGIASAAEHSREALLKRWSDTCSEKIHHERSHVVGNLGFRPGAWWINPLFAYHAGIIGLESCEGGTTYDRHGAYALLLKDTCEVEATSEKHLTYRVSQHDRGKFRLTAATPKSRDPIRVLRSHSINSIWGPRAGVRYEGLYRVEGWSIRTAKSTDSAGGDWKEGDIVFEVTFERTDPVPMEEVIKHPTASEVDDYSEYKRLRRVHREGKEGKRKGPIAPSIKIDPQLASKAASPILPLQPQPAVPGAPRTPSSPSTYQMALFKRSYFEDDSHQRPLPGQDLLSPMTVPDTDQFPLAIGKSSTLAIPVQSNIRSPTQGHGDVSSSDVLSPAGSSSTAHTVASNIREVTPWIDFDAGLTLPSPSTSPPIIREQIISQALKPSPEKKKDSIKVTPQSAHRGARDPPSPVDALHDRRESGEVKGKTSYFSPITKKDSRKSMFVRSRNPMAKLFDGMDEDSSDHFGNTMLSRTASLTAGSTTPKPTRRERACSSDGTIRVHSPMPIRPSVPESPITRARRDAICPANDLESLFPVPSLPTAETDSMAQLLCPRIDDPFIETPPPRVPTSLPISLKKFISQSVAATPLSSETWTPIPMSERSEQRESSSESSVAALKLRKVMEGNGLDVKIAFRNPFGALPAGKKKVEEE